MVTRSDSTSQASGVYNPYWGSASTPRLTSGDAYTGAGALAIVNRQQPASNPLVERLVANRPPPGETDETEVCIRWGNPSDFQQGSDDYADAIDQPSYGGGGGLIEDEDREPECSEYTEIDKQVEQIVVTDDASGCSVTVERRTRSTFEAPDGTYVCFTWKND